MLEGLLIVGGGDEEAAVGEKRSGGGLGDAGGLLEQHGGFDLLSGLFAEAGEEEEAFAVERFAAEPFFDSFRTRGGVAGFQLEHGAGAGEAGEEVFFAFRRIQRLAVTGDGFEGGHVFLGQGPIGAGKEQLEGLDGAGRRRRIRRSEGGPVSFEGQFGKITLKVEMPEGKEGVRLEGSGAMDNL